MTEGHPELLSMNSQEYNELRIHATMMGRGETTKGVQCPWCKGGRNGDKAFSLTKREDNVVLFLCHRAKCGRTGRLYLDGTRELIISPPAAAEFTPRRYTGETGAISPLDLTLYGLTEAEIRTHRLAKEVGTERLVVPISGPGGQLRGYETRLIPGKVILAGPPIKTLHYKEKDEPWIGWFTSKDSKEPIVLVEDVISAMKVARQFVAVSLMSSHMTLEEMVEVLKWSDDVCLCLDRDATNKALKLKVRFQYVAPKLKVIPLQRDLKWEPDDEIRRIIQD